MEQCFPDKMYKSYLSQFTTYELEKELERRKNIKVKLQVLTTISPKK
jgi:hypothetical protein